ncbi:EthD domain-containing protein [Paenibacillus donghaensis]|nr:EthD domain-containing protein [Paenibacillus donghaensis]
MFKIIALVKRKSGMSLQEFIDYYESTHAKLGEKYYSTCAERYARRYLHLMAPVTEPQSGGAESEFDVVTELWFTDRQIFEKVMAEHPEALVEIAEDEENFQERSKTQMFTVEEHDSECGDRSLPYFKVLAMVKRKSGMSLQEFINYYESKHAKLGEEFFGTNAARYARRYLHPMIPDIEPQTGIIEATFDVLTELWFKDSESFEKALAEHPDSATRIAKDEENFQDRSKTQMFILEEYESKVGPS